MSFKSNYKTACYSVIETFTWRELRAVRKMKPKNPTYCGTILGSDAEQADVYIQCVDDMWSGFLHIQGDSKKALRFNDMNLLFVVMGAMYEEKVFPVYKRRGKYKLIAEVDGF